MPTIEVIYENGVFKPLRPVELPEGSRGEVFVLPQSFDDRMPVPASESPGQKAYRMIQAIADLPFERQPDEQTNIAEHHDEILYPKNGKMP